MSLLIALTLLQDRSEGVYRMVSRTEPVLNPQLTVRKDVRRCDGGHSYQFIDDHSHEQDRAYRRAPAHALWWVSTTVSIGLYHQVPAIG